MNRQRLVLFSTVLFLVFGCGDAVTNPQLDGFDSDPRVLRGTWSTIIGDTRFDAELEPAGGVFIGRFEFFQAGVTQTLFFNDGRWDGIRLVFNAQTRIGEQVRSVEWEAIFIPASAGPPALPEQLTLRSEAFPGLTIDYFRPSALF